MRTISSGLWAILQPRGGLSDASLNPPFGPYLTGLSENSTATLIREDLIDLVVGNRERFQCIHVFQ